jgi:acetyl esterase/lipase
VKAAIEFVRKNADTYRVDPQRMGTFGTSAGGTLSLTIGAESRGTYSTGWEVAGSASWSGAVSFSLRAESLTQDSEPENPALLTYVFGQPTADAEGSEDGDPTVPDVTEIERADPYTMAGPQSAAVFLANSADELVPEEFATQFAARLDELGVPNELQIYPGVQHSTALRPRALRPTVQFFDQYVRGFDPEEVRTTASANPTETEPVDTPPVDTPPPSNPVGGGIPILPIAIVAAGALVGVVVGVRLWVSRRQINE